MVLLPAILFTLCRFSLWRSDNVLGFQILCIFLRQKRLDHQKPEQSYAADEKDSKQEPLYKAVHHFSLLWLSCPPVCFFFRISPKPMLPPPLFRTGQQEATEYHQSEEGW